MSVQVCPWNDRECGDRESSWCHCCPKRIGLPQPITEQRVREIIREELRAALTEHGDEIIPQQR
jgi:hypothetical protein